MQSLHCVLSQDKAEMAVNRYHDLLDVGEDIANPDYYQLLGLQPARLTDEAVEERFKSQMSKIQQVKSVKHKEFVEFLKGELKNARRTLTTPKVRETYDKEQREERIEILKKFIGHMLVEGTITPREEQSILQQGAELNLSDKDSKDTLNFMIHKLSAKRIKMSAANTSKRSSNTTVIAREKLLEEREKRATDRERRAMAREKRVLSIEMAQSKRKKVTAKQDAISRKQLSAAGGRSAWFMIGEVGLVLGGLAAVTWLVLEKTTSYTGGIISFIMETVVGPIHIAVIGGLSLVLMILMIVSFKKSRKLGGAVAFWMFLITLFLSVWPFIHGTFDKDHMELGFKLRAEAPARSRTKRKRVKSTTTGETKKKSDNPAEGNVSTPKATNTNELTDSGADTGKLETTRMQP